MPTCYVVQVIILLCSLFHNTAKEDLETSPYDDTSMDTHMASLVAGKRF